MVKDIRIIPEIPGTVTFEISGTLSDTGLALLQRLYILLFSTPGEDGFRTSGGGLDSLLVGANIPGAGAFDSLLGIACAGALEALDAEDFELVESFTGRYVYGECKFTLVLKDGTTIEGTLKND